MFKLSRILGVFTMVIATIFAALPAIADPVEMLVEKDSV
jgi:hypothetical protein